MKKIYLLCEIILLFTLSSRAQDIRITQVVADNRSSVKCSDKPIYYYYTTNGLFNKDNAFSVLISNNYGETWEKISGKDSSGILKIIIPESFLEKNNFLYTKVVSSSPKIESYNHDLYIYSTPRLTITEPSKRNVGLDEIVYFNGVLKGKAPFSVSVSGDSVIYDNIQYLSEVLFKPSKSGLYSVAKISNECGVGEAFGSVAISVNPAGFNLQKIPQFICQGATLYLNTKPFGNWNKENPIAIRLLKDFEGKTYYDIPATINGDVVFAVIPETVPENEYYMVKIVGINSKYESEVALNTLSVYQKSSVDIITESSQVISGATKELKVQYKGLAPFYATLSDGTQLSNLYRNGLYEQSIYVTPFSTTDYKIASFSNNCGTGVGQNKIRITLNGDEVIRTDSLKSKKYCAGETSEVYYSSSKKLEVGSIVSVVLTNYPSIPDTRYFTIVEGIVKDKSTITFKLPNNPSGIFDRQVVFAQVRVKNMKSISYTFNSLYLLEKPNTTGLSINSGLNLPNPQEVIFEVYAKGGEPYTLTFNDGLVVSADKNNSLLNGLPLIYFNVTKDKEYRLKSIANFCGTTDFLPSYAFKFTVANPAKAEIELTSKDIAYGQKVCDGQKIKLDINTIGTFQSGLAFNVELLKNASDISGTIIASTDSKTVSITIPTGYSAGEYFLRVYSTNNTPIYSNVYAINIATKASASISTDVNSIFVGTEVTLTAKISGTAPFDVTYLDGSKKSLFAFDAISGNYVISEQKTPSQTTTYGLKSISNVCGEVILNNKSVQVTVKPFNLINDLNLNTACLQSPLIIPFHTEGVIADTSTRFSIEIAKVNDTSYVAIKADIKASPAFLEFPKTFSGGAYNIRLVSNKTNVRSNVKLISIIDIPKPTFGFDGEKKELEITAGQGLLLSINTGNPYVKSSITLLENGSIKFYQKDIENTVNIYKLPTKTSIYTLSSISNYCGTREVNETIKVNIKPGLFHALNNSREYLCLGKDVDLNIGGKGDFGADNIFKVKLINYNTNLTTEVLSTKERGNVSFKIPEMLDRGYYTLQVESTNPVLKSASSITIASTQEVVLSGPSGQIINPGDETILKLALIPKENTGINLDFTSYSFEFTDSTRGFISTYLTSSNLRVNPKVTQTYTLKTISNACGVGKASGSVKIIVNPPSVKKVLTGTLLQKTKNLCRGTIINLYFTTNGTFTPSNKFTVQISDKNGENFKDIETSGSSSPLAAKIPIDTELQGNYLFRVVSSDKDATSTTTAEQVQIVDQVTARFVEDSFYYQKNKMVSIKIKFTSIPGYTFTMGRNAVEASKNNYYSVDSIYTFTYSPEPNSTMTLFSVSNDVCGIGTIKSPSTTKVELITGIEELINLGVKLFPNPTDDKVMIESDGTLTTIRITDSLGKVIDELDTTDSQKEMSLSSYPSGVYFFQIFKKGKVATFKVYKL